MNTHLSAQNNGKHRHLTLESTYLLFEMESLGGALARPLTPAVREGSELALLVCAPSLPQVLGLRLAKKEDLGD